MTKSKVPQIRFKGFIGEWEEGEVGKFYDFKNGLNKGKEFFGYGIPIVNFTDVFHNRSIKSNNLKGKVSLSADEIANYNVKQGDIFFTRTSETINEIGYPAVMMDSPINTVFSGFVLRARAIDVDPMSLSFKQYIFFTNGFRSEMVKKSSMTTRALTSGTAIKKMYFTFPKNRVEQTKIGDYFQKLDKLIEQKQMKYQKLKQFKKAMLSKMFPKNGADTPEIRFKGFSGKWEEKSLGNIANITIGEFVIKTKQNPNSPYPVYNGGKSYTGFYDEFNNDGNKIIISARGANAGYVNFETRKYWAGNSCYSIDFLDKTLHHIEFFYYYIKKNENRFTDYQQAANIPSVSKADAQKFIVHIPKIAEQTKIGNYFQKLDTQIELQLQELQKLKNIKKASLSKMFV